MNREEQQLRDEIALREASLGDAKREFESGELTKERYEAIVSREETAIVLASDKIGSLVAPAPKVPVRRIRKKRWLVVAITAFSLASPVSCGQRSHLASKDRQSLDQCSLAITPRFNNYSVKPKLTLPMVSTQQHLMPTVECSRLMQKM